MCGTFGGWKIERTTMNTVADVVVSFLREEIIFLFRNRIMIRL